DALQVVLISRNVGAWIRRELESLNAGDSVGASVVVVVGTAGSRGDQLLSAAATISDKGPSEKISVLVDPMDNRAEAIHQLHGVDTVSMELRNPAGKDSEHDDAASGNLEAPWYRAWGPGLACVAGAAALLGLTAGKVPNSGSFPWPAALTDLQVLDATGPRTIRLIRATLAPQTTPNWGVSDVYVVQGNPDDGVFGQFQVHVNVTNLGENSYYLSPFDFKALDSSKCELELDPIRTLKLERGLSGRWIGPKENWSGWLVGSRQAARIVGLSFHPDRATRIVLTEVAPTR
ncbi:MAG TPA: hypothetical protein VIV60_09660, partial [Polyangiaceae bacterium]